jgi:nucleotide-binding universal stress UspA family protein
MAEVKKILFALELADISKEVAPWVALMGEKFGAEIHVLHVVPEMDYYGVAYALSPRVFDDQEALVRKAEQKVQEFCSDHFNGNAKISARYGDPVDTIVQYIATEEISLAVLGTHGRKGLDRMIFGSVADRVLRFSPVPVLCVNPFPVEPEA